ncbi:hypothetical protein TsFJ059_001032 [Trichoderma semiorbis]|uniref:Uncharacterized protein n=1 Tax=Trichoderma semiorbis TaxID=1491008 RepID=A0A9P8KXV5_9HYPO|nr:hypothetical protein TsFJ059_001032 [Trichoderma semiorbis]
MIRATLQILAVQMLTDVDIQDRSDIHAGNSTPRIHIRTIEMVLYEGNTSTVMYDFIMEHMYGQMPKIQDAAPLHANRGHIGKPPPTRLSNEA